MSLKVRNLPLYFVASDLGLFFDGRVAMTDSQSHTVAKIVS